MDNVRRIYILINWLGLIGLSGNKFLSLLDADHGRAPSRGDAVERAAHDADRDGSPGDHEHDRPPARRGRRLPRKPQGGRLHPLGRGT